MKYRIPEPGTTISGFVGNGKKKLMPTNPRFYKYSIYQGLKNLGPPH
jgi:hypothetical protein